MACVLRCCSVDVEWSRGLRDLDRGSQSTRLGAARSPSFLAGGKAFTAGTRASLFLPPISSYQSARSARLKVRTTALSTGNQSFLAISGSV